MSDDYTVNAKTGQPCDWRHPNAMMRETFDAQVREARRRRPLERALKSVARLLETENREEPRRAVEPMGMTTRDDGDRAIDEFHRRDRSQLSKEQVNYRYADDPARSCGTCSAFDGKSGCRIVAGLIRRVDVCDRWTQV